MDDAVEFQEQLFELLSLYSQLRPSEEAKLVSRRKAAAIAKILNDVNLIHRVENAGVGDLFWEVEDGLLHQKVRLDVESVL